MNTITRKDLSVLNKGKFIACTDIVKRRIIEHDVCEYFEVGIEKIWSPSRKSEITMARHLIMYLVKQYTKYSLKDIAAFYNRTDHTTARNAQINIKGYLDPRFSRPEGQLINNFLYRYVYKVKEGIKEQAKQRERELIVDSIY
jgi:chromosomal replication initiation ATPase DnaA